MEKLWIKLKNDCKVMELNQILICIIFKHYYHISFFLREHIYRVSSECKIWFYKMMPSIDDMYTISKYLFSRFSCTVRILWSSCTFACPIISTFRVREAQQCLSGQKSSSPYWDWTFCTYQANWNFSSICYWE